MPVTPVFFAVAAHRIGIGAAHTAIARQARGDRTGCGSPTAPAPSSATQRSDTSAAKDDSQRGRCRGGSPPPHQAALPGRATVATPHVHRRRCRVRSAARCQIAGCSPRCARALPCPTSSAISSNCPGAGRGGSYSSAGASSSKPSERTTHGRRSTNSAPSATAANANGQGAAGRNTAAQDHCAGVGLCFSAAWRVVCGDGAQILGIQTVISGKPRFFRMVWGMIFGHMRLKRLIRDFLIYLEA